MWKYGGIVMPNILKLKPSVEVPFPEKLVEGYEVFENYIQANVSVDKIEEIMRDFIVMHDEADDAPFFFILELPANQDDEAEVELGIVEKLHKDIYYVDGCTWEDAMLIMIRAGKWLFNDGLSAFGYGCHNSGDEIMFRKYNVLTIYSQNIEKYDGFFEEHNIEQTDNLLTAWGTFSQENPGIANLYEEDGKTVYNMPQDFKDFGMYFAEQRETGDYDG